MKLKNLIGKYAFISHPYAGNPTQNKIKVDKVCKYWVKKGVIPISPLHMFSFYEDDSNREKILNICYKLIDIVDAVFIYGDSEGCRLEKAYAEKKGKPVFVFMKEKELTYENNKT
jgi:nucleoside 2-deoxyribosyltransferase